jgi:arginine exporter protein ArgO
LPLIAALIPLFLALLGLVFVLALVAGIPTAAWIGSVLKKNLTIAGAVGVGAAVISIVWLIPVVGWLTAAMVLSIGLGAWINSFRNHPEEVQVAEMALES